MNKFWDFVIKNNNNSFLIGALTFSFPTFFLKRYYNNNAKNDFYLNGKSSCITLSFDCDYPADVEAIPALLKELSSYKFKTSFACVGYWIEKYPDEHKMIIDHGHEIVNHTYSHPDNEIINPGRKFKEITRQEKMEEITRCHDICKKILNYAPIGCRIPHFKNLFSEDIYGILQELDYVYSSSTLTMNTASYGFPFRTQEGIWEFPLSTCPKHPFTVFDTWHSLNSRRLVYRLVHRSESEYLSLFKLLVDIGINTDSYLNIYMDPLDINRMKNFKEILFYLEKKEKENNLWIADYREIISSVETKNVKD